MYRLKPGIKGDPVLQWTLSDRVFFACGACQVLAYAFLTRWPEAGFSATWIRPKAGFTGNHIFVSRKDILFDYHGYSHCDRFLEHEWQKARRWWPGWDADLVPLPVHVLVNEALSKTYPGLWLRQPDQFLHNALPRARAFLDRYGPPPEG
ncbi:MAG: hypothetical protein ACRCUE_05555 [Bosea sp. (in: a-proteobacteria)]